MAKLGLAIFGPVVMFKASEPLVDRAVDAGRDYISMKQDIPDIRGQIDENIPQKDRERFEQLLDVMAKTPHGRELIRTLGAAGTQLSVVDAFEKDSILGEATGTGRIDIKRESLYSSRCIWTLAHEATHVQNKANFWPLPQTLDDAHTLNIIDEALAERNAFVVLREVMRMDPNFMTQDEYRSILEDKGYSFLKDQKSFAKRMEGKKIFEDRMKNTGGRTWVRGYESQSKELNNHASIKQVFSDDPVLVTNPNWDKVVQHMSKGEVRSVPCLPIPTWNLIGDMILDANLKGACAVNSVDLSCAEQHKKELLAGDIFKVEVFQRIKDLLYYLDADHNEQIATIFKDLVPDCYFQGFIKQGWMPSLDGTVEGQSFLARQTNQGYLNKAIKALKSPAISEIKETDEIQKANIEETEFILNSYKHVFFEKDSKHLALNQGRASSNIQL